MKKERIKYSGGHLIAGIVTKHPDGRQVYITSGNYEVGGRLSNFFSWKEVQGGGELSALKEHGYGWTPEESFFADIEKISF